MLTAPVILTKNMFGLVLGLGRRTVIHAPNKKSSTVLESMKTEL